MTTRNPVVCITGGSSGIGAGLARAYAARGASLVLVARREERLRSVAQSVPQAPVELVVGDVTQDGVMEEAVARARGRFGRLDVMVANAGFGVSGALEELTVQDVQRQLDVNVLGVVRAARASIAALRESKGNLALMGSVNAYVAFPAGSPYAMSKAAVRALADCLWLELRPSGVSVTHLAPGFIDSEIRRVDNSGVFQPGARDPIPAWARMDADVAARKMVRAIEARKKELVITPLGVLAVWVARHAPWMLRWTLALSGMQARPEPNKE